MQQTVLVVEDDPSIVAFVEMALQEVGYHVAATVGAAALPLASTLHPDMILLDLQMPGMDGGEVSRRLRADPTTAAIPIVVMSAQASLVAAADLPVDDRLPKPFLLEQLYRTVARWTRAA